MPKKIIWSLSAQQDFDSILNYLQNNWDEKVVIRFIEISEEIIVQISFHPKQFPLINTRKKIRKCVLTRHNTIYYTERKDVIYILRIFDTRQDPQKLRF